MQTDNNSITFTVRKGLCVKARPGFGDKWMKAKIEDVAPWGALLVTVPQDDREPPVCFAAPWEDVEITPNVARDKLDGFPPKVTRDDNGKCTGVTISIKLGDEMQARDGLDGDQPLGRIVEICENGVFLQCIEGRYNGEVFGCRWDGLLVYPEEIEEFKVG